jgi:2-polyprenyl-3-methyl-5-hydroxy-6-metoxy-1,4-benzoquinol methylase
MMSPTEFPPDQDTQPENTAPYHYEVDISDVNVSHTLGIAGCPPGSRVLDVGCFDGSVARVLKQRACTVVGIDVHEAALETARTICDAVAHVDLNSEPEGTLKRLSDVHGPFDAIVALDVLEHVTDPLRVLKALVEQCLVAHGRVILSLPNIAHGSVRLALLQGRFDYQDYGIMDRTHVRFFTRSSALALINDAGLEVVIESDTRRQIDSSEVRVSFGEFDPSIVDTVVNDPTSDVYQFVFVAVRKDAPDAVKLDLGSIRGDLAVARETAVRDVHERALCEEIKTLGNQLADAREASESSEQLMAQRIERETDLRSQICEERDQLQRDLTATLSSQTWKLGRLLTYPLRRLRKE